MTKSPITVAIIVKPSSELVSGHWHGGAPAFSLKDGGVRRRTAPSLMLAAAPASGTPLESGLTLSPTRTSITPSAWVAVSPLLPGTTSPTEPLTEPK